MTDLNIALILRFIDQATGPARAALAQVRGAAEQVARFSERQQAAGAAMVELSNTRLRALRGQALATAGMAGAMAAALAPAVRFEAQMDRVAAVSGASAAEQQQLTRTARELGAATRFSATEAARGMEYLAMAGFDVSQTVAAMPGLLDLAAAAGADLGRTADIASNILSGFALEADQMGRLGDVLTNTFTSSNTTLEMLGATMSYVAPAAQAAGVSLEQAAAMAGLLGNTGIQGERAGTALRAILSRLAAPADEAAAALERLGVQVSDDHGNLRDIPTVLAEMDRAMQGMGSATRQELMTAIFGLEAATAAQVLMTEAGTGALDGYADRLRETGTAAAVAARMNDNAQGALLRLRSAVEELQIALGDRVLPQLADLVERIAPLVQGIGAWIEANPELAQSLLQVVGALVALNLVTLVLRGAFWLLVGGLGRLRVALAALASLATAHPLLALASAIALAATAIYQNWDGIVEYFQEKFDRIRAAFDEGFLTGLVAAFKELNPFVLIRDAVLGLIEWLTGVDLAEVGGPMIQSLWDGAVARFGAFLDWARGIVERVRAAVVAGLGALIEAGAALIQSLWDGAVARFEGFLDWAGGIVERVRAAVVAGLDALIEAGAAMIQSLWDGAVARFEGFLDWVRGIPGRVLGAIGSIDLSGVIGFGGAPDPLSADPAERAAAARRAASLGYGAESTPVEGARAAGGVVRPGFLYRINELGEELFSPAMAGRILPASETRRLRDAAAPAGGGLTIGGITINAAPGMDPAAIARAVRAEIEALAREARFALHDGGLHA